MLYSGNTETVIYIYTKSIHPVYIYIIKVTPTEYLPSPTNETETTVMIVNAELHTVLSFKYRMREVHRLMLTIG